MHASATNIIALRAHASVKIVAKIVAYIVNLNRLLKFKYIVMIHFKNNNHCISQELHLFTFYSKIARVIFLRVPTLSNAALG